MSRLVEKYTLEADMEEKMSFTVETMEKNMAKLTIEVDAADVEKAIQKAYTKQKSKFNI